MNTTHQDCIGTTIRVNDLVIYKQEIFLCVGITPKKVKIFAGGYNGYTRLKLVHPYFLVVVNEQLQALGNYDYKIKHLQRKYRLRLGVDK